MSMNPESYLEAKIEDLEDMNKELLEALEALLRIYDQLMTRVGVANSAYFRGFASGARAVIAKAK